jgi:preprotein translocase subunit SecA
VEGRNFDIRKQLLEYDNVANDQRTIIYRQRNELMASDDVSSLVADMHVDVVDQLVDEYVPPQSVPEQWDIPGLEKAIEVEFDTSQPIQQWLEDDDQLYEEQLKTRIVEVLTNNYDEKCQAVGEKIRLFEKQLMLQILDGLWKEHLATMDHLRQGIFLRSYSGKNPKQEYKREAFGLFTELLDAMQREVIKVLSHVKIRQEDEADAIERQREQQRAKEAMTFKHSAASAMAGNDQPARNVEGKPESAEEQLSPFVRDERKVGRNEACPCGSGKKFKQCHGKLG